MLLFFSLLQINYFQKEIRLLFYLFVYRVILVDCFNSFSAVINLVSLQVSKWEQLIWRSLYFSTFNKPWLLEKGISL